MLLPRRLQQRADDFPHQVDADAAFTALAVAAGVKPEVFGVGQRLVPARVATERIEAQHLQLQ